MSWPPQTPVPPSPFATSRGPGTVGYWIGGLLILAAIGGGTTMAILGFSDILDTPTPVGVEGSLTLEAAADEGYLIYRVPSAGGVASLDCRVIGPSGEDLAVQPLGSSITLTLNGTQYIGDKQFQTAEAGEHLVSCNSSGAAVGEDIPFLAGFGLVFGGIALGVLGLLGGIGLMVITAVRRGRHQRASTAPFTPYPGPQPGPYQGA